MYHRIGRPEDGPRGGAAHLARIHGTEEDKVGAVLVFHESLY